jgi:hypothetical protein
LCVIVLYQRLGWACGKFAAGGFGEIEQLQFGVDFAEHQRVAGINADREW